MTHLYRGLPLRNIECMMYSFAHHLGKPLAYDGERNGRHIHDIRPDLSRRDEPTSFGMRDLGLHTEMAFHRVRPTYVLLFCIKNDGTTKTTFSSSKKILDGLDASTRHTLSLPLYKIHPPRSYTLPYPAFWKPVLYHKNSLAFAEHCFTEFQTEEARKAYIRMVSRAHQYKEGIVLEPGDLLMIDNRTTVHGRSSIDPSSSRWLKRLYVL